jgi:hypothetical protein
MPLSIAVQKKKKKKRERERERERRRGDQHPSSLFPATSNKHLQTQSKLGICATYITPHAHMCIRCNPTKCGTTTEPLFFPFLANGILTT